jgi:protein-S-isoprenylcysteine O-methyltransferase Ste14
MPAHGGLPGLRLPHFSKPYADFVARLRVPCGFAMVAVFVWLSDPNVRSLAWGLPVSFAGLLMRGWAAGHVEKNRTLATGGPYAHVRNPLYVGTLLVAAGLAIASRSIILAALFALVFAAIYLPVVQLEEQHLRDIFPDYADYAARVPALVPRLTGERSGRRFRSALYIANREYQAAAGLVAAVLLLVWKALP